MTNTHVNEPQATVTISEAEARRIPINRIQCYAGNPRRQANPEYDRIKASIRAEGLDQPLVVTIKPGEGDYLLQAGGNTRLKILKALYAETGDQRFQSVDCLVKPWVDESAVLLAHLRENELRGELHFIDKAQAVFEAKRLFEVELGAPELSLRRLEQLLRERGYAIAYPIISRMGYAVHRLLPLIPQALNDGLGRPQVEKIRALDRAACRLWVQQELGDESEFDSIFATLCQRYDAPDWDLESLRNALENEIADAADQDLQTIRLALSAALSGRELPVLELEDLDEPDPTKNGPDSLDDVSPESPSTLSTHLSQDGGDALATMPPFAEDRSNSTNDSFKRDERSTVEEGAGEISTEEKDASLPHSSIYPQNLSSDLESLRAQALTLATRLAQRNGLVELILPLPNQGLGFLLRDVPDPALAKTLDPELLGQVSTLWWQLAACAEMTVAPLEDLLTHLDEQSVLYQALANQDAGLLFESIWTLDPGQTGNQLWRQLNDQDWQDLLQMMATYRQLHQCAVMSGQPLWV